MGEWRSRGLYELGSLCGQQTCWQAKTAGFGVLFAQGEGLLRLDVFEHLACASRPDNGEFLEACGLAQTDMQERFTAALETMGKAHFAVGFSRIRFRNHLAADAVSVVLLPFQLEAQPLMAKLFTGRVFIY